MEKRLKEKAVDFYDNFVGKLLDDYIQGNPRNEKAIAFALSVLNSRKVTRVLDIGCGIGWSTYEMAKNFKNAQFQGVDLSSKLIACADQIFKKYRNQKYEVIDVTSDAFLLENKFDGLVMLDVYEHIPAADRHNFHIALRRLLLEDFIFVATCPSPEFQAFLKKNHPELMQPVDEDIDENVAKELANDLNGKLLHFESINIWTKNDYNHFVIAGGKWANEKLNLVDIPLENRDDKILKVAASPFKSQLSKYGFGTMLKANFNFLVPLARFVRSLKS